MDYESHMRAAMHPSLCNVVSYGEGQVGSMMELMTTDHHQVEQAAKTDQHNQQHQHNHHHHQQHSQHHDHHHQQHNDHHRQQLNIMQANSVSAPSSSSFTYYNAALEPYLQSALIQATHAFHHTHHVETHPPIISTLDHLEPSNVVMPSEEEKPDIGAPKIATGVQFGGSGRDCNYVIATSCPPLLVSPGANSTTHESRGSAGAVSMDTDNAHTSADHTDPIRAKIICHPTYPRLVMAYVNCNKIGAPAEVVTRLDEVSKKYQNFRSSSPATIGADPELDHFMETYCNVLQKYHDELMQPYKEAMAFFRKIELQLNALSKGSLRISQSGDEKGEANKSNVQNNNGGSSGEEDGEEEGDGSCGEVDFHEEMIDPLAEDQKLKEQLLRKYSGYICSLKQEFLKKKKKGKLPKDARQKLLDWWSQHYKWPYPSEAEKAALAETTGLDQKQINNWFINQRKRHWKPSEDMQYVMVDSPTAHHHHVHAHLAAHPLASYAVNDPMEAVAAAAAAAASAASILPSMQ